MLQNMKSESFKSKEFNVGRIDKNIIFITTSFILFFFVPIAVNAAHNAARLLHKNNVVEIYEQKDTGCDEPFYRLSVVFDVGKDFQFSSDFIKKHLPYKFVLNLVTQQCGNSFNSQLSVNLYVKNVFLRVEEFFLPSNTLKFRADSVLAKISSKEPENEIQFFKLRAWGGKFLISPPYLGPDSIGKLKLEGKINENEVTSEISSIERYLSFTEKEHASFQKGDNENNTQRLETNRKTRMDSMLSRLYQIYGVKFTNLKFAAIIDNNESVIKDLQTYVSNYGTIEKLKGEKGLPITIKMVQAYFWETTKQCGNKTVGRPQKIEFFYNKFENGEYKKVRKSGNYIIISEFLDSYYKANFKGVEWGNDTLNYDGIYNLAKVMGLDDLKFPAALRQDVRNLVKSVGCASEPFKQFEKYLLR